MGARVVSRGEGFAVRRRHTDPGWRQILRPYDVIAAIVIIAPIAAILVIVAIVIIAGIHYGPVISIPVAVERQALELAP